jgi:large subunit ribosomal protein L9
VKVVLRQSVDQLGERGQIVSVSPGYARNFLLPKGMALEATPGNLRTLELQKKVWMAREAREIEEAKGLVRAVEAVKLTVAKKVGEGDTLYGSVTTSEIAELLEARGFSVDRRKIVLAEPIKKAGVHAVTVKIHPKVAAKVEVEVVAESE